MDERSSFHACVIKDRQSRPARLIAFNLNAVGNGRLFPCAATVTLEMPVAATSKAFIDLDARCRINSFIADVHNKERLHSEPGYQSPLEFENAFAQNKPR